jgi:hypothetical protein
MVPLVDWHTPGQIRCAASDLPNSDTPEPLARGARLCDPWCTLERHHALHVMGLMADTLRATLRDLAQSDARLYRGLADITATTERTALPPADEIAAAIALLEAHGYTVTRG